MLYSQHIINKSEFRVLLDIIGNIGAFVVSIKMTK